MNNNLNRIVAQYNKDKLGNPISTHIIRRYEVSPVHNHVQLDFIPDERLGIRVLDPLNIYQVDNSDEVVEGTFYLDGTRAFFDKTMASKTVLLDYYDIGIELIGIDRVYTVLDANGNVLETLGDIVRDSKTVIEALTTMGDILVVVEELKENIQNGNDVYERLGSLIDETTILLRELTAKNSEVRQTINDADGKKQEVITAINNAENKRQEVNTAINNANIKKQELVTAIDTANTKKTELENVTNTANTKKAELQNVINDSGTKKNELQVVINDSVTKKNELRTEINNGNLDGMKQDISNLKQINSFINVGGSINKGYEEYKAPNGRIWCHEFGWYATNSGGGVKMARIAEIMSCSAVTSSTVPRPCGAYIDGADILRFAHDYNGELKIWWHAWGYKKEGVI